MKLFSPLLLVCLLFGCSQAEPETIYKARYEQVKVPVLYQLSRPDRPAFTSEDNAPSYLLKLQHYAAALESVIDNIGTKKNK